MSEKNNGMGLGVFGVLGCLILFFGVKRYFPGAAGALLVGAAVLGILLVLLVGLIIFFTVRQSSENRDNGNGDDADRILAKGRANLMELRRLRIRIKDSQIREKAESICQLADKILKVLKEQPEEISRVRQFLNYYLPTLGKILLKYARLEESGVPAEDMKERTMACLDDIRAALEKLYGNLFEDDILDLTVEMQVLTQACKKDGLIADESFEVQDDGRKITLTL